MRKVKAFLAGKTLAVTFLGAVVLAPSPAAAMQMEPDRLLRLNRGFGDASYYFCFAQSREAAYGVQIFTEVVTTDARVTLHEMLSGADAATNPLPGRPWRDVRCMEDSGGGSNTFQTRQAAETYRQTFMASSRQNGMTTVEIPWPGKLGRFDKGSPSARNSLPTKKPVSKVRDASRSSTPAKSLPSVPKYVEVAGANGTIHLSPEVAARNQAAADEYRRKMDEFARAKAEHERKLALHEQSIAAAAAEKRAYEQKLAMNEAAVAAHGAAMDQYGAATKPVTKGAKGWMYCDARGAPGDKRRFYSRLTEVHYVPGEITIIDVTSRNRPAFKSYVAGAHSIYFATDSLLHCPYSTTSLADAEALMARDKRGDGNNGIEVIQTGWTPAS